MASRKQARFEEKEATTTYVEYANTQDINSLEKLDANSPKISNDEDKVYSKPLSDPRQIVAEVLSLDDDPTLNPYTFRMWLLGIGLSVFASSITTINTFRPQWVAIHTVFVAVLSYVIGKLMHRFLPSKGVLGRLLNPGPFNKKEHAAICIMTAAASSTPEAMMVLAVQKLYYNIKPSPVVGIFLVLSTQMIGYGMAGSLRKTLVYPAKMFYPSNLPTASLLENLHKDKKSTQKRMKVFWIAFIILFCWQVFPTYIMPVLAGVSIFCLTNQHSLFVTNFFGGSMANEGLGTMALSFDWTAITGGGNPLWLPFQTLVNSMVGYLISIGIYMGLYYSNTWEAKKFPFLSPQMFSASSTSTRYIPYNQTAILDKNYKLDEDKLKIHGLPHLTSSHAFGMTARNLGIMASIGHIVLWHWDDIKSAFELFSFASVKKLRHPSTVNWKVWQYKSEKPTLEEAEEICPHYRIMQEYDEVPSSWFAAVWLISAGVGLVTSRLAGSTLPWWAFFLALMISYICLPFFGALTAMFGFQLLVQPLIQMIGAYILPGMPLSSLYFGMYGFNSLYQAKFMLKDLKLGQYVHLAPRCVFIVQIIGTSLGCVMSYFMMQKITDEKREILLAIQGTNVWSGQMLQSQNSQAIGWGALAKYMYSAGARYQWVSLSFVLGLFIPVPFWLIHKVAPKLRVDYWNTAIITSAMAILDHGTHSALLLHYATGFFSQLYLRRYRTNWFIKYNYILSAGMDGGAAVIGFILVFAVFGAGGKSVPFPKYWGNNQQAGNYDYCMRDPGLGRKRPH